MGSSVDSFSKLIASILFDYERISTVEMDQILSKLPAKKIRWLAANHPDNRTRKNLLRKSGVRIGAESVINIYFLALDNYQPLITIGERVAVAPNVTMICDSSPNNSALARHDYVSSKLITEGPIVVGDDVWIGAGVTILPGVTIGQSSVIGAGAIVVNDVPEKTIVAGVPAKIIRDLA